MTKRIYVLAVVASMIFPVGASAQKPACGSISNPENYLRFFERYFRDDDEEEVRGNEIQKLAPGETQEVVTRTGECRVVLQAALQMLRRYEASWPQIEAHGYEYTVLRYGNYYAILVRYEKDPETGRAPDWVPLLIFRGHNHTYVTTILV